VPQLTGYTQAITLSTATEYIAQLEELGKRLTKENKSLKAGVGAFEILVIGRSGPKSAAREARRAREDMAWIASCEPLSFPSFLAEKYENEMKIEFGLIGFC
jgi:hypothetical protein